MSTQTIEYGYADGSANTIRPTSVRYPDGRVVSYDYGATDGADDRLSRPAAVKSDGDPVAEYAYLGGGTFVQTRYPEPQVAWDLATGSGANPYAGLNRFGRVIDNRWLKTGNSSSSSSGDSGDVDRIQYGYDRASNRTWRKNVVAREQYSGGNDELYAYDGVQRLQQLLRGDLNGTNTAIDDLTFAEKWGLDATGNWNRYKQDEDGSGWSLNQRREANQANEITEIAGGSWVVPEYDAAGNTVLIPKPADPTSAYEAYYDAWNRLVRLEDGSETVAQYAYDGLHRRITVDDGEAVRHAYFSQEWQVLEERLDASEEAERQFVWGLRYIDDLILRDRSVGGILEERLYALQDANWNVTAVVDPTGDLLERFRYAAYGTPTFLNPDFTAKSAGEYSWEFLYCGYRFDHIVNLHLSRNRYLHSLLGQWISRDAIEHGPDIYVPPYAYADSQPILLTDPLGLPWLSGRHHPYPLYLGGRWLQPLAPLSGLDHQDIHQFFSKHGYGRCDAGKAAWKQLSDAKRKDFIIRSLRYVKVPESFIQSNITSIMKNARPGTVTPRALPILGPLLLVDAMAVPARAAEFSGHENNDTECCQQKCECMQYSFSTIEWAWWAFGNDNNSFGHTVLIQWTDVGNRGSRECFGMNSYDTKVVSQSAAATITSQVVTRCRSGD